MSRASAAQSRLQAVSPSKLSLIRLVRRGCESLDTVSERRPGEGGYSARWILMHMIEEYARHNGHADLLRERIDGRTGE
ncbi:mycothiol transferase [Nocardia yamanashiensis]|uniref:mycothiol transferase n=1 Tax=Nocardia yamanashiensis TaxID=209247 RepID=UPI0038CDBD11